MLENEILYFPKLGFKFNNSNNALLNINNKCESGLYISEVFKGSLLDKYDIRTGDIICKLDNIKIDNYGELYIDHIKDKIHFLNYLKYKKLGDKIELIIVRNNERLVKNIINENLDIYKIKNKYPKFEKIDYIVLCGMVFMELSNNHLILDDFGKSEIIQYKNMNKKLKERIIITKILNGSKLSEYEIFKAPFILKKINDKEVFTLEDFRREFNNYIVINNKKYISFFAENNSFYIMNLEDIKKEEAILSKKIKYPLFNLLN
tara:strand:- start:178 stop:963 length:786 start_codon:yes stop_codon:yes gene_type:complete